MEPPFPLDDLSSSNSRSYYTETTPLQRDKLRDNSFKVICGCFAVLTVIVSIALGIQLYSGHQQVSPHGAVVSDSSECTRIGVEILEGRGNAVDASVATTLCLSVVQPHLTSIGGSGIMLIYNHHLGHAVDCVDFSPGPTGVPGLLKGLFEAHKNYGKMKWKTIVTRVASLARNGFIVSESLSQSRQNLKPSNRGSSLDQWLQKLKPGSFIKNIPLASALDSIAEGVDEFYAGTVAKDLLDNFKESDLRSYSVVRGECLVKSREEYTFFTTGNFSGGPHLIDALTWVKLEPNATTLESLLNLKDVIHDNEPYLAGIAVNVMDHQDLYVSVVSGLGEVLGAQTMSSSGFLLNSLPNSTANSAFTPVIAVQKNVCGERIVFGSTDYRDALQFITSKFASRNDLQTAVESPRVRLKNGRVELEEGHAPSFSLQDTELLVDRGVTLSSAPMPYPSLNAVQRVKDEFFAYADSRGQGLALVL